MTVAKNQLEHKMKIFYKLSFCVSQTAILCKRDPNRADMLSVLYSGSGTGFDRLDLPADDAARHCRHDHRLDYLGRLPDATGRHSDRSRHLLPEPHPQWNHLAYRVHAHRPQVLISKS